MSSQFLARLVVLCTVLGVSGCVTRHGDFTVISNKLLWTTEFELNKADRVEGVEGKDVTHIILIFPIGGRPTLERAIDDALEKAGGDVMTDAVVRSWSWYVPYLYGQRGWAVRGDVVQTRPN